MLTVEADACIVLFNAAAKQLCGRPCKMALGPGDRPPARFIGWPKSLD